MAETPFGDSKDSSYSLANRLNAESPARWQACKRNGGFDLARRSFTPMPSKWPDKSACRTNAARPRYGVLGDRSIHVRPTKDLRRQSPTTGHMGRHDWRTSTSRAFPGNLCRAAHLPVGTSIDHSGSSPAKRAFDSGFRQLKRGHEASPRGWGTGEGTPMKDRSRALPSFEILEFPSRRENRPCCQR